MRPQSGTVLKCLGGATDICSAESFVLERVNADGNDGSDAELARQGMIN